MSRDARINELLSVWERAPVKPTPEQLCAGDPLLLPDVRAAIADLQSIDRLMPGGNGAPTLEAPATFDVPPSVSGEAPDSAAPSRIGAYRITGVLGRGGMGVVYEAEQDRPRRTVALKVIAPGWVSHAMLRRFEYEAEVLARLDHPGIARVYEVGTAAPDGRGAAQPFFAMELVRGARLDEYARRKRLSTPARLRLFAQVCQAVHHAHTKGVIHRDLKPANILVTNDGQPKVLDFGVARATDSDIQATSPMHTQSGQLVGTLPYMAPEQAAGRVDELDTSSDVYALGVVAYELLSGRMPYQLDDRPLHEAVRAICEEEPSRLSSIDRGLRGDVETIVGKALAKEKSRRYATAGELGADVQRFLDYEPISARRPGAWYQFSRFARRNRAVVAGLVAVVMVLVLGIAATSWQAQRATRAEAVARHNEADARQQAAIAQASRDFLEQTLGAADPFGGLGDKVTVVQAMHEAVSQLDAGAFKDQPLVDAAIRQTIGVTLRMLSRHDEAEPLLRRSLEIRRTLLPPDDVQVAAALAALGSLMNAQGKVEAEEPLRLALDIRRRKLAPGDRLIIDSMTSLSKFLGETGRHAEAERLMREVIAHDRQSPRDPLNMATALNNLAMSLQNQGRVVEAEPLFREMLETQRRVLKPGHPGIASGARNLAANLTFQGKFKEAEPLMRESLEITRRALPGDHVDLAISLNNMAKFLSESGGDPGEVESHYRESLAVLRRALPAQHPMIATCMSNFGYFLKQRNKLDEAEVLLREAVEILRRGPDANSLAIALCSLGQVLNDQGKWSDAEALYREGLGLVGSSATDKPTSVAGLLLGNLGVTLKNQNRMTEAVESMRTSIEVMRQVWPPGHYLIAGTAANLGAVLEQQDKLEEAEPLLREALSIQRKALPPTHPATATTATALASLLRKRGNLQEAETLYREALEIRRTTAGDSAKPTTQTAGGLARLLSETGRDEEAAAIRKRFAATAPSPSP